MTTTNTQEQEGAVSRVSAGDQAPGDQNVHQQVSEKEQLLPKLKKILPIVVRIETDMKKIDELNAEKKELEEKQKNWETARESFLTDHPGVVFFIFVASLIVSFIIVGLPAAMITGDSDAATVAIIPTAILTVLIMVKFKQGLNDTNHYDEINELDGRIKEIDTKLREYCGRNNVEQEIQFLPQEYCFGEAINYFIQLFQTGRAETLKEAMNLFEEYLFREEIKMQNYEHEMSINTLNQKVDRQTEMLDRQAQMLINQDGQMAQIQRSANQARRAARLGTGLAIYNFVKRH